MPENFSSEELAAMRSAFVNPGASNEPPKASDSTPEPEKNAEPAAAVDPKVNETPKPDEPTQVQNELPKQKSFEEYLEERTAGKYKKWEDVESVISAPRDEFADDEVRHWNELKKQGVKLDKEFFELQNLNLDSLKDPKSILLQAMKLKPENKNLSDKTLLFQLEKKYGLSAWIDKDEAELTDEDQANKDFLVRDAQIEYDWMQDYKKKRTFVPQPDPEKIKAKQDADAAWQSDWERFVDDKLYGGVTNLSVVIDPETKDSFEYKISEADRKEIAEIMKVLPKNVNAMFKPFMETDSNGNPQINHSKVYQMLLRNKLFDQAVIKARSDGEAVGGRKEIEKIKNTNFTPTGSAPPAQAEAKSEDEAKARALKAQGKIY